MKKMLKPEIEFVKFNTEDVITTSNLYSFPRNQIEDGEDNQEYGTVNWGINKGFPFNQ